MEVTWASSSHARWSQAAEAQLPSRGMRSLRTYFRMERRTSRTQWWRMKPGLSLLVCCFLDIVLRLSNGPACYPSQFQRDGNVERRGRCCRQCLYPKSHYHRIRHRGSERECIVRSQAYLVRFALTFIRAALSFAQM